MSKSDQWALLWILALIAVAFIGWIVSGRDDDDHPDDC